MDHQYPSSQAFRSTLVRGIWRCTIPFCPHIGKLLFSASDKRASGSLLAVSGKRRHSPHLIGWGSFNQGMILAIKRSYTDQRSVKKAPR